MLLTSRDGGGPRADSPARRFPAHLVIHVALIAGASAVAALCLLRPQLLVEKSTTPIPAPLAASLWGVMSGIAALAVLSLRPSWQLRWPSAMQIGFALVAVGIYLAATSSLADWMIDDAGITFAYSKNLVEGHGLTSFRTHVPEEGYSNTSWMLVLAAMHAVGLSIPTCAKLLNVFFGGLVIVLLLHAARRSTSAPWAAWDVLLPLSICLGAPFLVWSVSGLEHGLQSLMMMGICTAPLWSRRPATTMAICGTILVLTRPEAPMLVAVATGICFLHARAGGTRSALRQAAAVAVIPLVVWIALNIFRLAYFGELMSNPYYAKGQGTSLVRVLNPLGHGWRYVFDWMAASAVGLVVPVALAALRLTAPLHILLAVGLVGAQLLFVTAVGGDWMVEFRFISPILPLLALLVAHGMQELRSRLSATTCASIALVVPALLSLFTLRSMSRFIESPSTPFSIILDISAEFESLGDRLGLADISLAHHDAGGITYRGRIDLIDLAGLCDRQVAKHLHDREFITSLLLEQRRPTFIFGVADNFAAGFTRFHEDARFDRDYVRVEFEGRPFMRSDLSHIRREHVKPVPGLRLVSDGGRLQRVVVTAPD